MNQTSVHLPGDLGQQGQQNRLPQEGIVPVICMWLLRTQEISRGSSYSNYKLVSMRRLCEDSTMPNGHAGNLQERARERVPHRETFVGRWVHSKYVSALYINGLVFMLPRH